ncbi:glycosyltransferase [Baekduia sp. Peel2402]|uniref:glycosyltransferase n=1 Tax=Baekduia sp. Peel2402 TaxID=3458296 RepID=UPI00403E726B
MKAEILCSSRELFGADRSALRLAGVLADVGAEPTLVLPAQRPELGLDAEARRRGISVEVRPIAIASSRGVEAPGALAFRRRVRPDVTIHNTSAVLGAGRGGGSKVMMLREWLEPSAPKHRGLAVVHRLGLSAVVGISADVLSQWRACVRGPRVQALVPNWLEDERIPAAPTVDPASREGILFLGRFNDWKGQDVLADAYEQAFPRSDASGRPSLTFVGAQPGTVFAEAAERLAERGRDGRWTVLPFTDDPTPHLERAALLVVPSLHPEPFGMVIVEALARGCRVLAFPGGGATDLAEPFADAMTVVPRSASDLAAALRNWHLDGATAQSVAVWDRTLDRLRSEYAPRAAAQRWREILRRVS